MCKLQSGIVLSYFYLLLIWFFPQMYGGLLFVCSEACAITIGLISDSSNEASSFPGLGSRRLFDVSKESRWPVMGFIIRPMSAWHDRDCPLRLEASQVAASGRCRSACRWRRCCLVGALLPLVVGIYGEIISSVINPGASLAVYSK